MRKHQLRIEFWIICATLASVASGLPFVARADSFTPSHLCSEPYNPGTFEDDREFENFEDEVEEYRMCIEDFVEEQNHEARKHAVAAEEAIEEWNNFVRYELRQ